MTAITGANSTLTQQLYHRLFDRLNTDGDDALSVEEIGAATADENNSKSLFNTLDADGDGRVMRAEMTPSASFGSATLAALIKSQAADGTEKADAEIIADLFDRADLDGDGDGALSADEMKAEHDLRRAANLDAGYIAGPVFMGIDKSGDGLLTQDEVGVARQIGMAALPASAIRFMDEMPAEDQQRFQAIREQMGLPPLEPLTEDQKTAQRAQWAADQAERQAGPEGTWSFLSREIEGLRTSAATDFAADELSDSLSRRLLQQIMDGAWATGDPA